MPPGLLHSQFEALEEPGPDENPVVVSIEPQPREIVATSDAHTTTAYPIGFENPSRQPIEGSAGE